ncbi:MAG: WD40/YVTN/BNR-like repeat-containing protein [Candidatus Limnocylindria bacterium]
MQTWGVIAAIVAIALFALLNRGEQRPTEAVSLPVVGADLHSLVVDPQDPSRLFIGSHSGVSVSPDGGKTWRVVQSLNGADAMGWAFTDDAILVGGHPGISVSTDAGKTFDSRNEGLPSTDVHALGAGGETIYAGLAGIGTFASTDGGQSWEARSEEVGGAFMGRILVDPADDQHLVAPDMEGGAVESSDGGRTWQVLGGVQGALWVTWDESDTDHIIVATQGSAAETTDGGQTWEAFDAPDGASIVEFSPDDPETLYAAVLEDPNARVFISRDGGGQWEQL